MGALHDLCKAFQPIGNHLRIPFPDKDKKFRQFKLQVAGMTEGGFLAGPDGMRSALGHVEVKNVIGFTQECVRVEPRSGEEIEGMAEALRTKEKSMISDMLKAFRVKEDSKMMRMMQAGRARIMQTMAEDSHEAEHHLQLFPTASAPEACFYPEMFYDV